MGKTGIEIPHNNERLNNKPKNLTPSKECLEKQENCLEKQKVIKLRETLERQEYKNPINIEVSGEKIKLNFTELKLKGKPVEVKELQEKLKTKNPFKKININDVSFSYKIEKMEGRESLDLRFDINGRNTSSITQNIKEQIEGTFGGTYERYKQLVAQKQKPEINKKPINKQEIEQLKQEASKNNKNKVTSIEGDGKFVMVITKPQGEQKIITSTGSIYSYEETQKNKKPNKKNNLTVQEILELINN